MEHVCTLVASPEMTSGFLGNKNMNGTDCIWVLPPFPCLCGPQQGVLRSIFAFMLDRINSCL